MRNCSLWDQVFDDSELAKAAYDHVERSLSSADGGEDNKYNHQRYFRTALAFKKFWEHEDIRSFLCMLNKHPKRNDKFLDINVLYYLFELITERLCDVRKTVCLLDGEGYDDKNQTSQKSLRTVKSFLLYPFTRPSAQDRTCNMIFRTQCAIP